MRMKNKGTLSLTFTTWSLVVRIWSVILPCSDFIGYTVYFFTTQWSQWDKTSPKCYFYLQNLPTIFSYIRIGIVIHNLIKCLGNVLPNMNCLKRVANMLHGVAKWSVNLVIRMRRVGPKAGSSGAGKYSRTCLLLQVIRYRRVLLQFKRYTTLV